MSASSESRGPSRIKVSTANDGRRFETDGPISLITGSGIHLMPQVAHKATDSMDTTAEQVNVGLDLAFDSTFDYDDKVAGGTDTDTIAANWLATRLRDNINAQPVDRLLTAISDVSKSAPFGFLRGGLDSGSSQPGGTNADVVGFDSSRISVEPVDPTKPDGAKQVSLNLSDIVLNKMTITDAPVLGTDVANRDYVDGAIDQRQAVNYATIAPLPGTNPGSAGNWSYKTGGLEGSVYQPSSLTVDNATNDQIAAIFGAGIDFSGTNFVVNVDPNPPAAGVVGTRILVKDGRLVASGSPPSENENGIYTLTKLSHDDAADTYTAIFTRSPDADQYVDLGPGTSVFVIDGPLESAQFVQTEPQSNVAPGADPVFSFPQVWELNRGMRAGSALAFDPQTLVTDVVLMDQSGLQIAPVNSGSTQTGLSIKLTNPSPFTTVDGALDLADTFAGTGLEVVNGQLRLTGQVGDTLTFPTGSTAYIKYDQGLVLQEGNKAGIYSFLNNDVGFARSRTIYAYGQTLGGSVANQQYTTLSTSGDSPQTGTSVDDVSAALVFDIVKNGDTALPTSPCLMMFKISVQGMSTTPYPYTDSAGHPAYGLYNYSVEYDFTAKYIPSPGVGTDAVIKMAGANQEDGQQIQSSEIPGSPSEPPTWAVKVRPIVTGTPSAGLAIEVNSDAATSTVNWNAIIDVTWVDATNA
jgi:hypothetical protein